MRNAKWIAVGIQSLIASTDYFFGLFSFLKISMGCFKLQIKTVNLQHLGACTARTSESSKLAYRRNFTELRMLLTRDLWE